MNLIHFHVCSPLVHVCVRLLSVPPRDCPRVVKELVEVFARTNVEPVLFLKVSNGMNSTKSASETTLLAHHRE